MTIRTIDDIKTANRVLGHYFFSKDTTKFFKSRVASWTRPLPDGSCLFITSEQDRENPRRWTLRICSARGDCRTMGDFQAYPSEHMAIKAGEAFSPSAANLEAI